MEFLKEYSLWFLLGLASVFTFFWLYLWRERLKVKWYHLLLITVSHMLFGVLFVKLFAFIEEPERGFGSMSLFGGLFFTPFIYLIIAKVFKFDKRQLVDLMSVCMLVTLACARVNCLISGCCKGKQIAFIKDQTVLWPTREIELVFYAVLITLFIINIVKRQNYGQLYPMYMISYGIFRFIIEFLREPGTTRNAGAFHISHLWAVICTFIGLGIYIEIKIRYGKGKKRRIEERSKNV